MSIAHHPKFAEWSLALDRLALAKANYVDGKGFRPGDNHSIAYEDLVDALRAFHELSEEIAS